MMMMRMMRMMMMRMMMMRMMMPSRLCPSSTRPLTQSGVIPCSQHERRRDIAVPGGSERLV